MRSYDELEGFIDYTSEEEWRKYVKSFIVPLWENSWILKEY